MTRIKRITAYPLRVSVPKEKVNCPAFFDQMLHRGADPKKSWEDNKSQFFGDVPIFAVKVEGDTGGPVGWSDSSRMADANAFACDARQFLGMSLDDIDARRAMLDVTDSDALARQFGHQNVHPHKCLETAALDFKALQLGIPLWKLFGEKVRDRLRVEYWSGFRTPQGAAEVAREAVKRGFIGLKLKANLGVDVAGITRAVFDAAGKNFHLNIDPNGRWDTIENSIPRANAMLEVSEHVLLEDPIYNNFPALAEIRRQTGIIMGVTVQWPSQIDDLVALEAADTLNIGGTWHQLLRCADVANDAGLPVWIGSGVDTGLSDLAAVHAGCTMPNCTVGSDLVGNFFRDDDLLVEPIRFERGHAILPDGPGRGIATDLDAIERFRVGDPIVVE